MKVDILIASLPVSALNYAPAAPALLKACVEQAGFCAKTVDLSQSFFVEQSNKNYQLYDQQSAALQPHRTTGIDDMSKVEEWLTASVDKIKKINPLSIGFSIFTYYMHRSAYLLSKKLKEECPNIKIILGGFGSAQPATSLTGLVDIRGVDKISQFNQYMKKHNLCDYFIEGEGEESLVNYLLESKKETVNDNQKLYNVPISDFTDYDLENYAYTTDKMLPITGSKGCVRKCTFCDIPSYFGRFKYRSGKDIAREIFTLKEKYNVSSFTFTDSLINGSLSALEELLVELAEYNQHNPTDKVRWNGQYISRPKGQTPERIYELMSQSGAEGLTIGLESGSNDVLKLMNKKVKIEDVDWEMELFDKYRISTVMLFLIGFHKETEKNFLETVDTIFRYQKYVASGTLLKMELGHPLAITAGTELFDRADELGIIMHETNPHLWESTSELSPDFKTRVRRRLTAQLICDQLNIPTGMAKNNLGMILSTVKDVYEQSA